MIEIIKEFCLEKSLCSVEIPKRIKFVSELWLQESGFVTDSLKLKRREIEKFCFADTLLNRIVYDSVDPSPFTKDVDPK